jgi:hypothetical protein
VRLVRAPGRQALARYPCHFGSATFAAALAAHLRYRDVVSDEPGVVVRKRVRTGPLPMLPREDLEPSPGLEGRLPLLFLIGFLVLVAIQVALAL